MRAATILGLAAPALCSDVSLTWRHEKSTGLTSLSVYNAANDLIAQSCSNFINGSEPIDFSDVTDNGFGNFTVGDTTYLAHHLPDISGGPICTKKFNQVAAVVECSGLEWNSSRATTSDTDCHSDAEAKALMAHFTSKAVVPTNGTGEIKARDAPNMNRRASPPDCVYTTTTSPIGDGDPHQNYLHKQLSEVIDCESSTTCSVGNTESVSFTIGWSASASAAGWVSGGFDVSESWTTGNTYTCTGQANDELCIWYNTAHTAYTVANYRHGSCGGDSQSDPFVMYSPNSNNDGGGYYCVIGTCRAQGDSYWDYSGPAGGPP